MKSNRLRSTLLAAFLLASAARAQAAPFGDLARWVPEDANVVLAVDTARALATPLATQKFWRAGMQMQIENRKGVIFPKVERQLIAAHFDTIRDDFDWEVLLLTSDSLPSFEAIAAREKSKVERVGGASIFPLRGHLMAAKLNDDILGVRFPAERQSVARWVRAGDRHSGEHAEFIKRAIHEIEKGKAVLSVALDLDGALSPDALTAAAGELRSLRAQKIDPAKAASLFAGLKSLVLGVSVDTTMQARLELEFSQEPTLLAPVAAPVVREAIDAAGMTLDEMKDWQGKVEGRRIVLTGDITPMGVMRICSLLTLNKPKAAEAVAADAPAQDPAAATLEHFKAVTTILEDVQRIRDADEPAKSAIYLERYARKIEALSLVNVDPAVTQWSAYVSTALADCSYQLREADLTGRRRLLENTNPATAIPDEAYPTRRDDRPYSAGAELHYRKYYQRRENVKVEQQTKIAGRESAIKVLREIDQETIKIRREMAAKHKLEF